MRRSVQGLRFGVVAAAAIGAVTVVGSGAALAQGCCVGGPVVVYGAAPVPPAVPPTGYILDPSDARRPMYVVDQGPLYRGPGIYAVPTFSEGGYAYTIRYPYTWGPAHRPYKRWYGPRRYGYVGPSDLGVAERVAGAPPYGAYEVRPAPRAKVIDVTRVARAEVIDGPASDPVATGSVPKRPAPKAAPRAPGR
ncbi:hypothetical protein [Rhodoplanes elegans]|uniref:hypothetical protein n=1 Tax=Rhodoplanes elegans TaxID=29408 RepID=UPI00191441FE|nr:hypothetical protein [Rhodoplanes elegans]